MTVLVIEDQMTMSGRRGVTKMTGGNTRSSCRSMVICQSEARERRFLELMLGRRGRWERDREEEEEEEGEDVAGTNAIIWGALTGRD
jgi:hypothetical protein